MSSINLRAIRKAKGMTLEELAEIVGTSKQTIHRYERGIITNIPPDKILLISEALGTSPSELMGWEKTAPPYENIHPFEQKKLPLLGEIACGEPIFANREQESFTAAGSPDADFCLKAHGDSMIGARIYDGDIVLIKEQDSVENGEIAAVIVNDEATLKRVYYYPEEGKLILSPENPRYAPLVFLGTELDSIRILGKAVAFQSRIF